MHQEAAPDRITCTCVARGGIRWRRDVLFRLAAMRPRHRVLAGFHARNHSVDRTGRFTVGSASSRLPATLCTETLEQIPVDESTSAKAVERIRREHGLALRVPDLHEAGLIFK
jgi:hypothetical protein